MPLPPPDDDLTPLRSPRLVRWAFGVLAAVSLLLAVVGVVLPVVPTVPFVLLAAWAASRCSPRLDRWLETHPHLGPSIVAWRRGGVVPRRAKWVASVMMAGSATGMLVFVGPRWFVLAVVAVMVAVGAWLWRRPEVPPSH
jgi:hypothetical protein